MQLHSVTKSLSRALVLAGVLLFGVSVMAQSTFVITNGEAQKRKFAEVGQVFLAINEGYTGVEAVTAFNERCVWHRTGKTGYYYQNDAEGNTYFLRRNGENLQLDVVPAGQLLSSTTSWYDWSFGVATQELGGDPQYHWIVTNADNTGWMMSGNTYGRPGWDETKGDNGLTNDGYGNSAITNDQVSNSETRAYGLNRAATFNPVVTTVVEPQNVYEAAGANGLSAATITTTNYGYMIEVDGANNKVTANVSGITDYTSQTTPGYTMYELQYVTNPSWTCTSDKYNNNSCYNYGYAGGDYEQYTHTPVQTWYCYGGAVNTAAPAGETTPSTKSVSSYVWTLSGPAAHFLSLESTGNVISKTVTDPSSIVVYYTTSSSRNLSATLTLTAYYSDGTTQTLATDVHVTNPVMPTGLNVASTTHITRGETAEIPVAVLPHNAVQLFNYGPTTDPFSKEGTNLLFDGTSADPGEYTTTLVAAFANGIGVTATATDVTVYVHPEAPDGVSATASATGVTLQGFLLDNNNIGYNIYFSLGTPITDPSTVDLTSLTKFNGSVVLQPNVPLYAISVVDQTTEGDGLLRSMEVYTYLPTISSGTGVTLSDGVVAVILNDLEDHSWSYYSDPDCPIRSLNPADVKITYYGNGTNNMTSTSTADAPANTAFDADATGVRVGIASSETENTFVYYKTLERTDGATATTVAGATGRCAYTTIPNPFQVRPTYGTGDTRWRGFYAWRVKSVSGGTIYSAATGNTTLAADAIINAETEIYFAPTSEYGMEVELEALWARAYVVTSNATNGLDNGVSYERNFVVLRTGNSVQPVTNSQYPHTISSVYPNGTSDGTTSTTTKANTTIRGTNLSGTLKYEYITWAGNNYNICGQGNDVIIGRGCSGNSGNVSSFNARNQGGGNEHKIRVESGTYASLYGTGNGRETDYGTGHVTITLGCDYDRATGTNTNLTITGRINGGMNTPYFNNQNNRIGVESFRYYIKSGSFNYQNISNASEDYALYMPISSGYDRGTRTLIFEGGRINSIGGGQDHYNTNVYDVNDPPKVYIRVKGGDIYGSIYGGGEYWNANGNRKFVITGGTIRGWIAGGANGTQNEGGRLFGNTYIYVGGNATCSSNNSSTAIGSGEARGGNIFGAGSGNSSATGNTATVGQVYNSYVVISDNANIERNVYGGGNYGFVSTDGASNIYILGGTVNGGVFGGSNMQQGQTVNITMKGGKVLAGVFGGSNTQGTINNNVTINVLGGQVGTSESVTANVHGGGFGNQTRVTGNVDITIGDVTTHEGPEIFGDVYGGSAMGYVNGTSYGNGKHTYVTVHGGTIKANNGTTNTTRIKGDGSTNGQTFTSTGSVYGGGLGTTDNAANVYAGTTKVTVTGGTMNNTFGANNVNGMPYGTIATEISGGTIGNVYGGGNAAPYGAQTNNRVPTVLMTGGHVLQNVFGGGLGSAAIITNDLGTDVKVQAGTVDGNVYGGGAKANVTGNTNVEIGK